MSERTTITLREHGDVMFLARDSFSDEVAETLLDQFKDQVDVDWPTPKNHHRWALRASGWVGHIPLGPEYSLYLEPKVEIGNLFRMIALAYDLDDLQFPPGLTQTGSLKDVFEHLAVLLSRRVLDRARRGLFREYLRRDEDLPYVRGTIDFSDKARRPVGVRLPCLYDEHTSDNEDNQILAWTLHCIARGGVCSGTPLQTVRRAYRVLQGASSLHAIDAEACIDRLYHRLNEDYKPLHGLCRFFLEHAGPAAARGNRTMLPFLINMPSLFERFVARWLEENLPWPFTVTAQQKVDISVLHGLRFQIDLVVSNGETGETHAVLDTKYKRSGSPQSSDIHQIIAYAHVENCSNAWLIYPESESYPVDTTKQGIRVRTGSFDLDSKDLDQSGQAFLRQLELLPDTPTQDHEPPA